jgi:hypothetical protein
LSIDIAVRLHPLMHQPGVTCLIPRSELSVQVFPALIRLGDLEWHLPLKGPIQGFTVEQDLEKGAVHVFGRAAQGFFRYCISREDEGIRISFEKDFEKEVFIPKSSPRGQGSRERLSLGMHRSQDWAGVQRRRDLREIFPAWLRLSQMLPPVGEGAPLFLLKRCREVITCRDRESLVPAFLNFFDAHFSGILAPRLFDDQFQGLVPEQEIFPDGLSPLFLLKESGALIRELFFKEGEESLALLPCLPPEFHSGRFISITTAQGDSIDIEWSKKLLRRAIIRAASQRTLSLGLQKEIQTFRLRRSLRKEQGVVLTRDDPLFLERGETLYLDRFQK